MVYDALYVHESSILEFRVSLVLRAPFGYLADMVLESVVPLFHKDQA